MFTYPFNTILIKDTQITCLIVCYQRLDILFLIVILSIFQSFLQPINNLFNGLSILPTYFPNRLFQDTIFFYQGSVKAIGWWFCVIGILLRGIVFFHLLLGNTLIVVAG